LFAGVLAATAAGSQLTGTIVVIAPSRVPVGPLGAFSAGAGATAGGMDGAGVLGCVAGLGCTVGGTGWFGAG
jgi:hypothetical protein